MSTDLGMTVPLQPDLRVQQAVPVLLVWPSVPVWRIDGDLWLDRKFKDGMDLWLTQWPGRIKAMMTVLDLASVPPFGAYRVDVDAEGFELAFIESGQSLSVADLAGVDVLLASADDMHQLGAPLVCQLAHIPCIFVIEYTLTTRLQMNRWSPASRLKKIKTFVWLLLHEMKIRRAMGVATSVQANGLPAFKAYADRKNKGQVYFDTRLPAAAVIDDVGLETRLQVLRSGGPLRLAFSGRLISAKGADALVPLAVRLRELGLPFVLDIYGSGELESAIAHDIDQKSLADVVRLRGPVDFETELVPALKREIDLFVCCHRQGDPSCTYSETFGCGVPIVGFANESLAQLVDGFQVGWTVPMNHVDKLADLILKLGREREEIARKSYTAARFGKTHSFESTFLARINHCLSVLA